MYASAVEGIEGKNNWLYACTQITFIQPAWFFGLHGGEHTRRLHHVCALKRYENNVAHGLHVQEYGQVAI